MFYTIITRAKLTFTIFDSKLPKHLKEYLLSRKLVKELLKNGSY
jgi:hypothetical protein